MKINGETIFNNKRARYDFEIEDELEVGLSLTGSEVKSCRLGKASLDGAYVYIAEDHAALVSATINEYEHQGYSGHEIQRNRKILMHKQEMIKWSEKAERKGYTIVPIKLYFNYSGKIKLLIGLGKGKKLYDKRQTIKEREAKRKMEDF